MAEAVPRPLTSREQAALVALITRGVSADGDVVITGEDRDRWLQQVPDTRAGDRCNCGTCPSIELTDRSGTTPGEWDRRVVLEPAPPGRCCSCSSMTTGSATSSSHLWTTRQPSASSPTQGSSTSPRR